MASNFIPFNFLANKKNERKFAISAKALEFPKAKDEFLLAITHDSFNWETLAITPNEAKKIIETLQLYLMNLRILNKKE